MALNEYRKKRKFKKTPEPRGDVKKTPGKKLRFVVQEHHATHLHYDLRLEMHGVLKSWAVPKGPSMDPDNRRLAILVEDHPLEYGKFEGTIPEGNYGAGDVYIWDKGYYLPLDEKGLEKGHLDFAVMGKKLKGGFSLIKMKGRQKNTWLLIKQKDEYAEDSSKKSPMPRGAKPMLSELVDAPFDKEGWIFEIKWDGYRAMAEIEKDKINLYSRNQISFNEKFKVVVDALKHIKHDALIDGEIIALKNGRPDFHTLQNYEGKKTTLQYVMFDLLYLDGEDLRSMPLEVRREKLRGIIPRSKILVFSEGVKKNGKAFYKKLTEQGFEGVMAKDLKSEYLDGKRSKSWQKIKHSHTQEAIIIGYTEPRGTRKKLGALVLGAMENEQIRYIGHSGGGFTEKELYEIHDLLEKIKTKKSPVDEKVPVNSPITWVKPKYVCMIKFSEWTPDGLMRHPIFAGLRIDKKPDEVLVEKTQSVSLSNENKIFWPKEGYTKGDVINYYDKISDFILPYLKDRPESLNRHPDGIEGENFYHKNITMNVPDYVETKLIWSESNEKELNYLLCQNKKTLLYMANLGCIEINPWNSRINELDCPDYMILDLDPGGKTFENLILVAKETHKLLEIACEVSYVKTSGKKGIHIFIPLGAKHEYKSVRTFAELLANLVHNRLPDITSLERSPEKRDGKIYIDYLQNSRGQTLAAPYSLRPWPGATVSTPLEWKEIRKGLDPSRFNIKTIHKRLEKLGDIWKDLFLKNVDLEESIKCLEKEMKQRSMF